MFEEVLRFWLDRGVDGFRVDVAHGLLKEASLRDQVVAPDETPSSGVPELTGEAGVSTSMVERTMRDEPMWDQPEVHDVYRRWHQVLSEYDGDRMTVAEAWTQTPESLAKFVRHDEMSQAFNFAWLLAPWSAPAFAEVITGTIAAIEDVDSSPTWVLSNHDVVRHATRYGGGPAGLARARAATLTMLALPGSAYLYQGEELGLEQVDVGPEHRSDPSWFRTGEEGRDGCRVPIPWGGDTPPYDFGPGRTQPWLPQPDDWAPLTVAAELEDPGSTLSFYRAALAARREFATTAGEDIELVDLGTDLLAFRRGGLTVVLNCGATAAPMPAGEVVLASGPLTERLPADTAVWLRS
jgi:alpha-glucosidase